MFRLFSDHKGGLLWWQPGAAILQRAKKKKVTNFNDHDRSLLRRLPGATILQRENQTASSPASTAHQAVPLCKFSLLACQLHTFYHKGLGSSSCHEEEGSGQAFVIHVCNRQALFYLQRTNHARLWCRCADSGRVQEGAGGYRRVQEGAGGCRRVQEGTGGYRSNAASQGSVLAVAGLHFYSGNHGGMRHTTGQSRLHLKIARKCLSKNVDKAAGCTANAFLIDCISA